MRWRAVQTHKANVETQIVKMENVPRPRGAACHGMMSRTTAGCAAAALVVTGFALSMDAEIGGRSTIGTIWRAAVLAGAMSGKLIVEQ